MQHVNCSETLEINREWQLTWETETETTEAGIICKFDLTNNLQPWTLNENFTCGTSSTRVVMCNKGFELIKKVGFLFSFYIIKKASNGQKLIMSDFVRIK